MVEPLPCSRARLGTPSSITRVSFTTPSTGTPRLKVTAPAHGFMAPPEYYMLFILKPSGETGRDNVWFPSRGHILKLEMQLL